MKIQTQNPDEKTTVLRCGHANVRVQKLERGRYTTFRLFWKVGRKTYTRAYNDEVSALAEAERVIRHLATCDGNATALRGEDVSYFNECKERLGSIPMHAAVEFYLKFHEKTSQNPQTFAEVWDLFYQKVQERQLSNRYYQTLRHHRNVWAPEFGKRFIDTISNEEYLTFLRGLKYQPRTKHNLFGSLVALLRFARKQRFISQDKLEIEADFPAIGDETPEFYSPKELLAVFAATDKRYLAYTALMAFGGSRRSEAGSRKLKMSNILFEEKMIRLSPEITKTRTGRTLDITPNLEAWLKEFGPKDGPLVATHKIHPPDADLLKALGVQTKDNALRHSFCSYHLALHRNSAMTAEVAGNSPTMLAKHYKALVSKIAAEEWFSITPDSVRKFALEKGIRLEW
jgi:hypothetical protein